jgi:hypothetical protein
MAPSPVSASGKSKKREAKFEQKQKTVSKNVINKAS